MRIQRNRVGSRVRIQRGRLPIDPSTIGRVGVIVQHEARSVDKYAVQLDGEAGLRVFAEDELELYEDGGIAGTGSSSSVGGEAPF